MKTVKIRILDEVYTMILGLSDEHQEYFYEKYAVHAPNYFFQPEYKLGHWDGRIRFFHKNGKTFVYLLEDIIPRIVTLGYNIKVDDLRTASLVYPQPVTSETLKHIPHPDTEEPIELRQDQIDAVNGLLEHGNGIVVASTGAGKTFTAVALIMAYNALGLKTITIVPNKDLIRQSMANYVLCHLDTGEYSGTSKTLDHQNVISTWQALKNNPTIIKDFQVVIVDEVHGVKGSVLSNILTEHAGKIPYRFGFTGTLPKENADSLSIHAAVGPQRYTVSASHLIKQGVLANIHIDILQLQENLEQEWKDFCNNECLGKPPTYIQFKDKYFPDFDSEKSYLRNNSARLDWIASFIEAKRDMKKGNVLCLVDNIAFGRKLAKRIKGAIFVNGKDIKTSKERGIIYDMFKTLMDLVVIATVHIAGVGLNIKRIFNLMLIDMGKSFIRVIQAIGRGMRVAEDKQSVLVNDICSDLKYGKRHCRQRMNFYDEVEYPYKKHKIDYKKSEVLV